MIFFQENVAFIQVLIYQDWHKNSLKYKYCTFRKTHFNYVFIQIKQLVSNVCAFVVLCIQKLVTFLLDNINFQNLKDVIVAAQLEMNGTSF